MSATVKRLHRNARASLWANMKYLLFPVYLLLTGVAVNTARRFDQEYRRRYPHQSRTITTIAVIMFAGILVAPLFFVQQWILSAIPGLW